MTQYDSSDAWRARPNRMPKNRPLRLSAPNLRTWALSPLAAVLVVTLSSAEGKTAPAQERTKWPDALHGPDVFSVGAADPSGENARFAIDGKDETAWTGRPGESQWRWTSSFARPVHIGVVRAHFGSSPVSGVPVTFRWEIQQPGGGDHASCERAERGANEEGWTPVSGAAQARLPGADGSAQATRRSWFTDVVACALRLVVDRTNAGPPVLREVEAIETASDVLLTARASDDGTYPGFRPEGAVDGTYAGRWAGAPGKSQWVLRIDLPSPELIDRIRLVIGFDATSVPRGGTGRSYAVAWAPLRYTLEVSEDGRRFVPVAREPTRANGAVLPLRRRLVALAGGRFVRSVRIAMNGATGESGLPDPGGVPVVREIAAYRANDKRPILAPPWILSVNANPALQSHGTPGGEVTNDAYHAKFLQGRLGHLIPELMADDRYARALGPRGEPLDAPPRDEAGQVLESIEGDDPLLDAQFLAQESPPPIAVLSGSNDWDYADTTAPDRTRPRWWHWNPLRDASAGGMGQLAAAVQRRVAPFLGFCGGAQILALLEARRLDAGPSEDLRILDRVLRRTSGRTIRGFAAPMDVERAWPTDSHPVRAAVAFVPNDPLFSDLAGPLRRSTTQALPESHADVVRPDAFATGGPLDRFQIIATSAFCAPDVVPGGPGDAVFRNPTGPGWCDTMTEAFRSRDPAWPVIGAQFHAEQRDFTSAAPGDPPESTADARLFLDAAYESMVDAYVKLAP